MYVCILLIQRHSRYWSDVPPARISTLFRSVRILNRNWVFSQVQAPFNWSQISQALIQISRHVFAPLYQWFNTCTKLVNWSTSTLQSPVHPHKHVQSAKSIATCVGKEAIGSIWWYTDRCVILSLSSRKNIMRNQNQISFNILHASYWRNEGIDFRGKLVSFCRIPPNILLFAINKTLLCNLR